MRIENPNAAPVSTVTATDKSDLQAALLILSGNAAPTFSQVRQAMPAGKRARFTDGFLHETAAELELKVRPGAGDAE